MWETILQGNSFMLKLGGAYFHVGLSKKFTFPLHFIKEWTREVNFSFIFIFCTTCKSSEQTSCNVRMSKLWFSFLSKLISTGLKILLCNHLLTWFRISFFEKLLDEFQSFILFFFSFKLSGLLHKSVVSGKTVIQCGRN